MTIEEVIALNEQNIRQALRDYAAHTSQTEVLDDISDTVITTLAKDSAYAKANLRELFRKSPVWDEQLQALVINGTRTHDPDYSFIERIGKRILEPACYADKLTWVEKEEIIKFFSRPTADDEYRTAWLAIINRIAPKAYKPTKKPSRVFKAICQAVGVVDETAGSEFQRLYAQFADELSAKRISFKLFVSINPAHFLTMSNPKCDGRGPTLTSCHSLNSTEYEYNVGCSGYARDDVSFIAFTASDPRDPETLNNRKTTRQVFAYQPGNGVLMQSRLYNTSGGTNGAQAESKVYRDLIQREISALEETPNLWQTGPWRGKYEHLVHVGEGFGGYADWTYDGFEGKVSIRKDHEDAPVPLYVGTYGRCICCAKKIDARLYCDSCDEDRGGYSWYCDDCDCGIDDEDDLWYVYDSNGNERRVCESCRSDNYAYCDCCGDYYEDVTEVAGGDYVCPSCLERYYSYCEDCEEYHKCDYVYAATNECGRIIDVCQNCLDDHYITCAHCGEYIHEDYAVEAVDPETGETVIVCPDCKENHYADVTEMEEETV